MDEIIITRRGGMVMIQRGDVKETFYKTVVFMPLIGVQHATSASSADAGPATGGLPALPAVPGMPDAGACYGDADGAADGGAAYADVGQPAE